MASPQVEDGYTRIANEVIEHLFSAGLTGTEWDVVMLVIRDTWGWKQKMAGISLWRFRDLTGRPLSGIRSAVKSLQKKNLLVMRESSSFREPAKWQVNKDWESWKCKPRVSNFGRVSTLDTVPETHTSGYQLLTQAQCQPSGTPIGVKKDLKKRVKKQTPADAGFDAFWELYPLKVAKKDAQKAWSQVKPLEATTLELLHEAILAWKATDQWQRGSIPYPASWLRGERWKDEVPRPPIAQSRASPDHVGLWDGNNTLTAKQQQELEELQEWDRQRLEREQRKR